MSLTTPEPGTTSGHVSDEAAALAPIEGAVSRASTETAAVEDPTVAAAALKTKCAAALRVVQLLDVNRKASNMQAVRKLTDTFGADLVRVVATELGAEGRRYQHNETVILDLL